MITEYISKFDKSREKLRELFTKEHPDDYEDIVKMVIGVIAEGNNYSVPDPERIVKIDHGDYQGTLLFVIAEKGYQPSTYYYVKVGYGSCSGCDTFQRIRDYDDEIPSQTQVDDYMTLALHIFQSLQRM